MQLEDGFFLLYSTKMDRAGNPGQVTDLFQVTVKETHFGLTCVAF